MVIPREGALATGTSRSQAPIQAAAALDDLPGGADASSTLASVARSALVLTGGTLVAQAFVVIRELFVAAQTGASSSLDALLVGIVLPTSIGAILVAGTTVALIPAYLTEKTASGLVPAQRFAGFVLNWVGLVGLLLWLLLWVFAPEIVAIAGAGLSAEDKVDAVGYLRLVAPVVFVHGLFGILIGVCQAEERFGSMAAAGIVVAGVSVFATLVLWNPLDLTAYALGNLIGPIAGLLVIVGRLARLSMLPIPRLRTRVAGVREWLGHALPLTVSAAVLQLNPVVDTAIASLLSEGAVSSMRFAQLLVSVPIGAISLAWGRAIYPRLVKTALDGDGSRLGALTDEGTRFVAAAFVPISMLAMAVAPLAVSVAFGRGEFTSEDVERTALALVGFAPTIVFGMLIPVLSGALNARRKGAVVLAGGILNVTLNLALSLALGLTFGILGIALATSLMQAAIVVFFANRVHAVEPSFESFAWVRVLVKAAVMATPGALLAAWVAWTMWPDLDTLSGLAVLIALGIVGVTTYFLVAWLVGISRAGADHQDSAKGNSERCACMRDATKVASLAGFRGGPLAHLRSYECDWRPGASLDPVASPPQEHGA